MNLQMDPLGNQLTTLPIQTGSEISIEAYPNWRFGCLDDLDYQFCNSLASSQTWTGRDSLEPLLTLVGKIHLNGKCIFGSYTHKLCSHQSYNRRLLMQDASLDSGNSTYLVPMIWFVKQR